MIFTCNFANWRKIPIPVTPISIAIKTPDAFECLNYPKLFPTSELLYLYKNGIIGERKYTESYRAQILGPLKTHEVIEELYAMRKDDDSGIVLLCYESSSKFCHRHLVRKWLEKDNFIVREFEIQYNFKTLGFRR